MLYNLTVMLKIINIRIKVTVVSGCKSLHSLSRSFTVGLSNSLET